MTSQKSTNSTKTSRSSQSAPSKMRLIPSSGIRSQPSVILPENVKSKNSHPTALLPGLKVLCQWSRALSRRYSSSLEIPQALRTLKETLPILLPACRRSLLLFTTTYRSSTKIVNFQIIPANSI